MKIPNIYIFIENKLIICALGNLHYKISREKFEPEPGQPSSIVSDPVLSKPVVHLYPFQII